MGKMFNSSTNTPAPSDIASNQTSSSSEFQVLSPPNSTQANGVCSPSHLRDLQLSVFSANFDLSPDEIQTRLREILRENLELKETLHENNVAMSEQFDRLSAWQREVKMVQEQQKLRFDETRSIIQKLHQENVELRQKLEQFEAKKDEDNNSVDEFELVGREFSMKDGDQRGSTSESERLSVINLQLKEELKAVCDKLEKATISRNHLIREKEDLLATNQQLHTQLSSFSASPPLQSSVKVTEVNREKLDRESGIRELLLQLHSEQEKSSALMAELMEERKMKSLLQTELNNLKTKTTPLTTTETTPPMDKNIKRPVLPFSQQGTEMLQELKNTEFKLSVAGSHVQGYNARCSGLEERLGDVQERMQSLKSKDDVLIMQLQSEIEELRRIVLQEQATNREDKLNLNTAHRQFETLLADYQQLLRSWETYEQDQTNKGVQSTAYYEIQVKSLKEQIDRLTAQLVANEETVAAKVDEANRLRTQLKASMQELEKMPILQAQFEVYQTDFRLEREAREKLHQEKEMAMKQVQELQAQCQQLSEEVDMHRQSRFRQIRDYTNVRRSHPPSRLPDVPVNEPYAAGIAVSRRAPSAESRKCESSFNRSEAPSGKKSPELNLYLCPKCGMAFTELQPLENHVNYCLDNDDPFL